MNDLSSRAGAGAAADMVDEFTHRLVSGDAARLIGRLAGDGADPSDLMLNLLAPAARRLGELWCGDQLGFMEVTLGLSRLQRMMREFPPSAGRGTPPERGLALLLPAPGEQHMFGLRMVEEFLRRDGWTVRLALNPDVALMRQLVASEAYDIVGFSISGERLLPGLRQAIGEVREASLNGAVKIMLGGGLVAGNPAAAADSGADALAGDAREAAARANQWYAPAGERR